MNTSDTTDTPKITVTSPSMDKDIIANMAEGVMTIDTMGRIVSVNRAAEEILGRAKESLEGRSFASCFFKYAQNDGFNQAILDAIYDQNAVKDQLVSFYTGEETLELHIITSLLIRDGEKIGLIVVFSDISELAELRDAAKAAIRIEALNKQLQQRNNLLAKTFGRYLSDEIVSNLLDTQNGLRLGGRKEHLTVMMSDLRGFTSMSELMPADQLLTMLNHYLGEMTKIIEKHHGTIIEFIGDGIMAIYGAPQPVPNHAVEAVAAGLEMQQCMTEINRWNEEQGFPRLQMGIGINTGDMIIGNIGSERRAKYGVTGCEVNLCGRIEGYSVGGQVLISAATGNEIKTPLEIADRFEVIPKGKEEPMTILRVIGIGIPYDLHLTDAAEEIEPLKNAVPTCFSMVEGKDVSKESYPAEFTAITENSAKIRSSHPLHRFDNLVLDIGGKLYAKVTGSQDGIYQICFTARPRDFEAWLRNQREGA